METRQGAARRPVVRRGQHEVGGFVPGQVFLMLPYLLSILALIVIARSAEYSKALVILYFKGHR
jgi:simple sugar transport system permease protein